MLSKFIQSGEYVDNMNYVPIEISIYLKGLQSQFINV